MTHFGKHLTGRDFWKAQAAEEQRRGDEAKEDAAIYTERGTEVGKTVARALQAKAEKHYRNAKSALEAAAELPE